MSHSDHLTQTPKGFKQIAHSDSSIAGIANEEKKIYGIQFHAELNHSEQGTQILENFLFDISKCQKDRETKEFIKEKIKLDNIATNAWSNALLCRCGDEKDKLDIHRLCIVFLKYMDYNNHYSKSIDST